MNPTFQSVYLRSLRLRFFEIEFWRTGTFLYQLVLPSTSLFADELELLTSWYKMFQIVPNFDKLEHFVPVCQQTSWYKMFQLIQIWHKLEHFIPAHFAEYQLVYWQAGTLTSWNILYQFFSKWTGTRQNELVQNVPVRRNSISISIWDDSITLQS